MKLFRIVLILAIVSACFAAPAFSKEEDGEAQFMEANIGNFDEGGYVITKHQEQKILDIVAGLPKSGWYRIETVAFTSDSGTEEDNKRVSGKRNRSTREMFERKLGRKLDEPEFKTFRMPFGKTPVNSRHVNVRVYVQAEELITNKQLKDLILNNVREGRLPDAKADEAVRAAASAVQVADNFQITDGDTISHNKLEELKRMLAVEIDLAKKAREHSLAKKDIEGLKHSIDQTNDEISCQLEKLDNIAIEVSGLKPMIANAFRTATFGFWIALCSFALGTGIIILIIHDREKKPDNLKALKEAFDIESMEEGRTRIVKDVNFEGAFYSVPVLCLTRSGEYISIFFTRSGIRVTRSDWVSIKKSVLNMAKKPEYADQFWMAIRSGVITKMPHNDQIALLEGEALE